MTASSTPTDDSRALAAETSPQRPNDVGEINIPIACDPSAIGGDWQHHTTVIKRWQEAVEEAVELPNGYGYRFKADTDLLMSLAEFVSRERLCCPFFTFQIEVNPGGSMWLRLTGPDSTKALLETTFNMIQAWVKRT